MRSAGPPGGTGEGWVVGRRDATPAAVGSGAASDYEIVAAMRRGDTAAFEQFVERFHRILLDYARRAGVPDAERDEFVGELLDDVAMQFMTRSTPLPQNPRMYLLSAFRNKLLNRERARVRRERVVAEAARDAYVGGELAGADVAAGCSESMLRESRGPGWEGPPLPRMLERLSGRLSEALSDDERLLLVAVAENIPQREIAEWLGVSYVVARKRLERLRARLTDVAMRYTNSLEPDDARELQRFFMRCRARIGSRAVATAETLDVRTREA